MARPARFSHDDVLDAAALAVAHQGRGATLTDVARELGGPTGSIYYRFASRDELMVSLWVRSIRRFHIGLEEAYALPDPHEALLAATRHIPRYCRTHPVDALAMTLYRREMLLPVVPGPLRQAVATINDGIDASSRELAEARYGTSSEEGFQLVRLATRSCPYGLVRPFVGSEVPELLDDVCVAAARGILALGDTSP